MLLEEDEAGGRAEETKRVARILQLITLIGQGPQRWTRARLVSELSASPPAIAWSYPPGLVALT